MNNQTISLYYREGSSDKEYHAAIEQQDGAYTVNFAYGRRGSTLQTGTKTGSPVDLDTATKVFNKLVAEKKAKGYAEGEAGTPYQHTAKEDRVSGIQCQLLNPIDEAEASNMMGDDNWCAQEKFDGKRILIKKEGAAIHGINRKGLLVGLPSTLIQAAGVFRSDFVLDGECIGDALHAFDLLLWNGEDLRARGYKERMTSLMNLLAGGQQRHIQFADTRWTSPDKFALLKTLQDQKREGIVFKRIDAPYSAGRPHSGGTQLKHKFYSTASVIVGKLNRQRSIEMQMLLGQTWITVGNVTIPSNHSIPKPGAVVEVRYLYAFPESRSLYQPVYLGQRSDVLQTECLATQLKFKNGEEEPEN